MGAMPWYELEGSATPVIHIVESYLHSCSWDPIGAQRGSSDVQTYVFHSAHPTNSFKDGWTRGRLCKPQTCPFVRKCDLPGWPSAWACSADDVRRVAEQRTAGQASATSQGHGRGVVTVSAHAGSAVPDPLSFHTLSVRA
jgi:squalene cyclase